MIQEPTQATSGRWWNRKGFVEGICHHTTKVVSITEQAQPNSCSLFLPAPVDLHVHGGGGFDCMNGEAAIRGTLRTHAQHGTGSLLATSVTAPFNVTSNFVASAAQVMSTPKPDEATLLGVHLEGPFINPEKLGAQPPHAASIDLNQLETWLDSGVIKVITFAPELDPKGELISLCNRYKVRVQIGHTNCSWQQAHTALLAGCGVTHLFNAMSAGTHRDGGAATAALAYAEYAEIILDGIHVDRVAFDLARRAIPKLYSVTDATAASGMPDGEYTLGSLSVSKVNDAVVLPDGTTAGSCLTQRKVISQLRAWEIDWHTIGALISAIPAGWINNVAMGNNEPGANAHWLEIKNDEPYALWLNGKQRIFE